MPGLLSLSSPVHAGSTKALAKYALIEVIRDTGGRPLITREGQFASSNWSGYVLPNFKTGDAYTSVQATWVVPDVPFEKRKHDSTQWIGIGGFCTDVRCRKIDRTLIQIGTGQDPLGGPENVYFSWYEMSPGIPFARPIGPHPGDVITASLNCNPCMGSQIWNVLMVDNTTGDSWASYFSYQSSNLSAEFIEGTSADQLAIFPLANYGTITFDQSFVNGATANLTTGYGIVIPYSDHRSSDLSPVDSMGDGFTACFGLRKPLTPCLFEPLP
jgi:hypothetical protein